MSLSVLALADDLVSKIVLASGWRRYVIAFFAGIVGSLALQPIGLTPAFVVPMSVAVWLIDGVASTHVSRLAEARAAFLVGWWLGFGYFIASLWWLGAAFLVQAEEFAWALPLGVVGLPAVLACFVGLGLLLASLLWSRGPGRVLALALALGFSEWMRSFVLTGFPWNDFGMVLGSNLITAQVASFVGLPGLTLLSVGILAAPALLLDRKNAATRFVLAACTAFFAIIVFGVFRLGIAERDVRPDVLVRVMQPNVPQDNRFRPENRDEILRTYFELAGRATDKAPRGLASITHMVWPESSFPFLLSRDASALAELSGFLQRTVLITGAARAETQSSSLPGERGPTKYFNAIQVVEAGQGITDTYDKMHLVPFGEYLPLSDVLETLGLRQFVSVPGGFEPGLSKKLLRVPGLTDVVPLVCYEAIFPGALAPEQREKAGLIVNVTNDGWFGLTAGPYQHAAQARLRSIETGLPLIRAANTGISMVTDPYGRVIGQLPLGVAGIIDTALPVGLISTLYSSHPVGAPLFLYLVAALGWLHFRLRRR